MSKRLVTGLVLVALLLGGLPLAIATAAPLPAIVTFSSSVESITVTDAEAETVTATLSWATVGLTSDYRLALHTYRLNAWELVFDAASVPLEPVGSREVTLRHPLNFGPPTFLLSILDAQARVIDQRTLSIPYAAGDDPSIEDFTVNATSLDATALQQGTALVQVAWTVLNRAPGSNLVFEQVFEDGTAVSVELPRANLWVPSAGQGPVAPVFRQGAEAVTLRLRVIDVVSAAIYAEAEVELPTTGTALPPVGPTPTLTPPPAATAATSSADILAFAATPTLINPGAAVTLTWRVRGVGGVTIEQSIPNMLGVTTVVTAQSPEGSAMVYLPDYAAYSVDFTLWTADRGGSATVTVKINCPYTFFFGEADGCPAAPAAQVQAVYQPFEGGAMLWRGDTREVYLFYDDGTASYYLETSYTTMPDSASVTEMPPLDRQKPVGSLGKVWANAPGVREKLGWALAPESAYTMQLQQVATSRIPPPPFVFYLTLPDQSVIGTGSGQWQTVD